MDDGDGRQRSPAAITAARAGRARTSAAPRAYAPPELDDDVDAVAAMLAATRALLLADTPEQVADVVATLVHDLGGALVPARFVTNGSAMPLDLSLGLSEPVLPWADPVSVPAMRLSRLLPGFVEDARSVVGRLHEATRLGRVVDHDTSTGLLTRRAWLRRLSTAGPGDVVCLVRLPAADHDLLRSAAALVTDAFGVATACGRHEVAVLGVLVRSTSPTDVAARLERGRDRVLLSAGLAVLGAAGPRAALDAASAALSRAGQTEVVLQRPDAQIAP